MGGGVANGGKPPNSPGAPCPRSWTLDSIAPKSPGSGPLTLMAWKDLRAQGAWFTVASQGPRKPRVHCSASEFPETERGRWRDERGRGGKAGLSSLAAALRAPLPCHLRPPDVRKLSCGFFVLRLHH